MSTPVIDPDAKLAPLLDASEEWKAHHTRIKRILRKRDNGKDLTKTEKAALADFRVALTFKEPPRTRAGDIIPPELHGYNEASAAFGITREQLYGMRSRGCTAFVGNIILTATLQAALIKDPCPKPVALNVVHTGAKGKHTKALEDSIVQMLQGCPMLSIVAAAHGVDESTLSVWRIKGEKGEKRYLDFFNRTQAAIAGAKAGLILDIASNPDWKAKARVLELTDPRNFGRLVRTEVTGAEGGPVVTSGDGPPPPLIIKLNGVDAHPYTAAEGDEDGD